MVKTFIIAVITIQLTACAGVSGTCRKDHRDRPWDSDPCTSMFEQLPNWESKLTIRDAQGGPAARDIVINTGKN
jgi:hypothetical protein